MDSYKLRIELRHSQPLIWRRLVVPSNIILSKLHKVIQSTMGWHETHPHCFEFNAVRYGIPDPAGELDIEDEKTMKLDVVLNDAHEFEYIYGATDDWQHRVVIESFGASDPLLILPACLAGEMACPPEEISGAHNYETFLTAIAEPTHKKHDQSRRLVGGIFDPSGFDVNAVNARLSAMRK